jgi:hypothetical protein
MFCRRDQLSHLGLKRMSATKLAQTCPRSRKRTRNRDTGRGLSRADRCPRSIGTTGGRPTRTRARHRRRQVDLLIVRALVSGPGRMFINPARDTPHLGRANRIVAQPDGRTRRARLGSISRPRRLWDACGSGCVRPTRNARHWVVRLGSTRSSRARNRQTRWRPSRPVNLGPMRHLGDNWASALRPASLQL